MLSYSLYLQQYAVPQTCTEQLAESKILIDDYKNNEKSLNNKIADLQTENTELQTENTELQTKLKECNESLKASADNLGNCDAKTAEHQEYKL